MITNGPAFLPQSAMYGMNPGMPSGMLPPGLIPPGNMPPGLIPPGMMASGMLPQGYQTMPQQYYGPM